MSTVENLSRDDLRVSLHGAAQFLRRLPESAPAGRGEKNDLLPRKIVAVEEPTNDRRRRIPPYRETQKDDGMSFDVRVDVFQLGVLRLSFHLLRASRLGVAPVQIRGRVGNRGRDLVKIPVARRRKLFRRATRNPRR